MSWQHCYLNRNFSEVLLDVWKQDLLVCSRQADADTIQKGTEFPWEEQEMEQNQKIIITGTGFMSP